MQYTFDTLDDLLDRVYDCLDRRKNLKKDNIHSARSDLHDVCHDLVDFLMDNFPDPNKELPMDLMVDTAKEFGDFWRHRNMDKVYKPDDLDEYLYPLYLLRTLMEDGLHAAHFGYGNWGRIAKRYQRLIMAAHSSRS